MVRAAVLADGEGGLVHSARLAHTWARGWSCISEPAKPERKRLLPQPQRAAWSSALVCSTGHVCVTQEGELGRGWKRGPGEGLGEKMERN